MRLRSSSSNSLARSRCQRHGPDAMTLDLAMPGLDGIGVLRALRAGGRPPIPVVVVSAFSPAHGARAVDALAEGAFDLVAKPGRGRGARATFVAELADKVRAAARHGPRRRVRPAARAAAPRRAGRAAPAAPAAPRRRAAAPSGPSRSSSSPPRPAARRALAELIPQLPAPLGAGTVIVQHMPPGFTASLAARLDARLAAERRRGRRPARRSTPTRSLLAPGGAHLRLDAERRVAPVRRRADRRPAPARRPRRSRTPRKLYGRRLLLVVLTGMGNDGLDGAEAVKRRRRPRPRRGRVDLHRLRHAARGGRGRPGRRGPRPRRAARRDRPGGRADERRSPPPRAARPARRLRRLLRGGPPPLLRSTSLQYKRGQMERRIRTFARAPRHAATCAEYARRAARATATSSTRFLDRVTINVSQLWRHPEQFEVARRATSCPSWPQRGPHPRLERRLAPTAPRPTRSPPSAARRRPAARRRDHRHRHRPAHGRARPRRASSPPRTPAASPPALLRALVRRSCPTAAARRKPGAASACAASRSATCCACRSRAGALRPGHVPQHRHLLHRRGARRAARAPRRRRCAPAATSSSAPPSASPTRAGIGLDPTHPFIYRKSLMDISEYLPMFLAEAREHLQELNLAVVRIEETPDDRETVDEIFRIAHSLKGMSATMGFAGMAALTHEMEDVFELLRQRTRRPRPRDAIDVLLECLDALDGRRRRDRRRRRRSTSSPRALIERLQALVRDRDARAGGRRAAAPAAEPPRRARRAAPAAAASCTSSATLAEDVLDAGRARLHGARRARRARRARSPPRPHARRRRRLRRPRRSRPGSSPSAPTTRPSPPPPAPCPTSPTSTRRRASPTSAEAAEAGAPVDAGADARRRRRRPRRRRGRRAGPPPAAARRPPRPSASTPSASTS